MEIEAAAIICFHYYLDYLLLKPLRCNMKEKRSKEKIATAGNETHSTVADIAFEGAFVGQGEKVQ